MTAPKWSRADFSGYFAAVYLRQILGLFNTADRRPNYRNPDVIDAILGEARRFFDRPGPQAPSPVPRRLFMLWQQGWNVAPPLVQACAASWQRHNPDWEINLLDDEVLADLAPETASIDASGGGRTARANIARLALLARHGGVWADATLFCSRPLDDWLPQVAGSGLFMFAAPRTYRQSEIWFMASAPESPVLAAWRDMVAAYWHFFRRPHHYYWMEYLFGLLLAHSPEAARLWAETPRLQSDAAEIIAANRFDFAARGLVERVAASRIPVHKLSHKWRYTGSLANRPVGLLTGLDRL